MEKLRSAISANLLSNKQWKEYKIADIATIGRGRVISQTEINQQLNPQYPVYSSQTSNDGIMGYVDEYDFDGEYITWTTDGANAGTVFYRNGRFCCTNVCGILKIIPNHDAFFIAETLQRATNKYVSTNLANPKLMNNTMASIKIRLPEYNTQLVIAKVLRLIGNQYKVETRIADLYKQQKEYLLQQLFI